MKDRGGADALAEAVAQNQRPRDHGHAVAQLVPRVDQRPAALWLLCVRAGVLIPVSLEQQRLQAFGNRLRQQLHCGVAGNALRGLVPKNHFALRAEHSNAIREAVERSFKEFGAIGHGNLSPAARRHDGCSEDRRTGPPVT